MSRTLKDPCSPRRACSVSLERILQTVGIVKHTVGIEEKGVRLRLNIIDTPGFGDAVNNTQR